MTAHGRTELKRFLLAAIEAEKWDQAKDLVEFLDSYRVALDSVPVIYYDPVMEAYRAWLVFGEWKTIVG